MSYEIRPLEWDAHDDAETPFGEYRAYADKWALVDDGWYGEYAPCVSLDAAKAACEADWRARIAACLVPVEPTERIAELERALVTCFDAAIPQAMPFPGTVSERATYATKMLPHHLGGLVRLLASRQPLPPATPAQIGERE